jgi:hypothetical protein
MPPGASKGPIAPRRFLIFLVPFFKLYILKLQRHFSLKRFCFNKSYFPVRNIGNMVTERMITDYFYGSFRSQSPKG